MLQESSRSARRAVQVPPLGVQFAQCEPIRDSCSEAVGRIGRGTRQIGVRVVAGNVGEASHPGPPLKRLRRVSSTHHDRGADDVDPTMRDSDDDAPLVLTRVDMPQSVQEYRR